MPHGWAKPRPNTGDFVALTYLPCIQDTSLQTLPGGEQRVEGERLWRGFRAFSPHHHPPVKSQPVWLLNDVGKRCRSKPEDDSNVLGGRETDRDVSL